MVAAGAVVILMVLAVPFMNERRHAIDLTEEQAPFDTMRLPLRYVGTYTEGERSSTGFPFTLAQVRLVDADEKVYTFWFRKESATKDVPGPSGDYIAGGQDRQSFKHPAKAWELCLHVIKESSDPPPPEYHELSGETPGKPPRGFRRMIDSIFK